MPHRPEGLVDERLDVLAPLPIDLPPVERRAAMPAGFAAGGLSAGIKASGRPDLAVVATAPSEGGRPAAAAAAVFTPNRFAAAPVLVSRRHLAATLPDGGGRYGWATGVVSTSGCANAATGAAGLADQETVAGWLAEHLGTETETILTLSTGVIGTRLPLDRVARGLGELVPLLRADDEALAAAARALMTTDSRPKWATLTLALPDPDGLAARPVRVTGIAKGVGMIHPRMATMLAVLLTDAAVAPATLAGLLRPIVARTWNQLTIDGDTSTNDTVFLLASGAAGSAEVRPGTAEAGTLGRAIEAVARDLARQQAADGEGATTLITCQVSGAVDDVEARAVARAVVASSLVKAAVHGRDPNWGRIAAAAGNALLPEASVLEAAGLPPTDADRRAGRPAAVEPDRLRIAIAGQLVFDGAAGGPQPFDRDAARSAMAAPECLIRLDLGLGTGTGEAFGCDLSEEYVVENSEYTT
jgi:glutamate N-acetyltransferase/amino-acid N-acetyltransferase